MSQYSRVLPAQAISVSIPSVILTGNGGNTGIGVGVKTGVVCGVGLGFGIDVGVKASLRASVVGVFTIINGSTVGVKTLVGVLVGVEQASTKRNRRRPTKEAPRATTPAVGVPDRVDGLPCDDHGHDGGLSCAGGELQGQAGQLGVGVVVGVGETVEESPSDLPELGRNLSQPDSRLNRLYLTEEGLDVAEVVVSPMLEQASGFGRDAPVVGIAQLSPLVDLTANLVHHRRDVVLLLALCRLALPRLGNGRDELRAAPVLDDLLGRLDLVVEFPVLRWVPVRGVEYGLFEEAILHDWPHRLHCDTLRERTEVEW